MCHLNIVAILLSLQILAVSHAKYIVFTDHGSDNDTKNFTEKYHSTEVKRVSFNSENGVYDLLSRMSQVEENETIFADMKSYLMSNILKELSWSYGRISVTHQVATTSGGALDYSDYHDEIAFYVRGYSVYHRKVIVLVYDSCYIKSVRSLMDKLHATSSVSSCYQLKDPLNQHLRINMVMSMIQGEKASFVVLLLKWRLIESVFQNIRGYRFSTVTFFTLRLMPQMYAEIADKYPFLTVLNIGKTVSMGERYHVHSEKFAILPRPYVPVSEPKGKNNKRLFLDWIQRTATSEQNATRIHKHVIQFTNGRSKYIVTAASVIGDPYVIVTPEKSSLLGGCMTGKLCHIPKRERHQTKRERSCCSGFLVEVYDLISDDIGIPFDLYIVEGGHFGALKNGSWNGIINDIMIKKADIGLQYFEPTIKRNEVVDFSHMFLPYTVPIGIAKRKDAEDYAFINFSFLTPMNKDLIFYTAFLAIFILLIAYALENALYVIGKGNKYYQLRESVSYINGILYQRDIGGANPQRWSARTLSIFYAFGMLALISLYTAHLTAENIQRKERMTFQGLKDSKFKDPAFKVGFTESTSFEMFVKHRKVVSNISQKYSVKDIRRGIEMVHNGSLDCFIDSSILLSFVVEDNVKYCNEVEVYADHSVKLEPVFAIQKGSPLRNLISESIMKFTENGKIEDLRRKWDYKKICTKQKKSKRVRVPWQYFGGLIIVLAIALVVSIVLLILEHFYVYKYQKQSHCLKGMED